MTTRHPRQSILVILLLAILAPVSGSWAQGTFGTLPDPVSARDLTRYADRLGLSDQQRMAIEMFHLDYGDQFRRLRETDIEEFVQSTTGMRFGMQIMTNPEALNDTIKDLERLMSQIASLDRRLFDEVQTMLTEEQALELQGVRMARKRARQRTGLGRFARFINPAASVDLYEIYADLELSPTVRQNVDPIMDRYEASLTSKTDNVYDGSLDLARDLPKEMEKAGVDLTAMMGNFGGRGGRGGRGGNRGGDQASNWDAIRQVWEGMMKKLGDMSAEISDLNRKTAGDVGRLLPGDDGWTFSTRFYDQAYEGTAAGSNPADQHLNAALRLDSLTAEQRSTIEGMVASYRASAMRLATEGADLLDDNRGMSAPWGGRGGNREMRDQLESLRETRQTLNETAISTLFGVLDPEQGGVVESRVASMVDISDGGDRDGRRARREGDQRQRDRMADATSKNGADPLIPTPITQMELARYASMLSLDEFMRDVVDSLHSDYMMMHREIEATDLEALLEARQSLWSIGDDGVEEPSEGDRQRIVSLRHQVIDRVRANDTSLLENLTALADNASPSAAERVLLARDRVIYSRKVSSRNDQGRRGRGRGGWDQSGEGYVDMTAVIADAGLDGDEVQSIDAALLEYERQITGIFRTAYETSVRLVETFESMGRGGNRSGMREQIQSDFSTARDTRAQITGLNRSLLAGIQETLPAQSVDGIRQAYYRQAFTDIYDDERSAMPRLEAAMALNEMTSDQRMALADVASDFRPRYEALCEQMVGIRTRESGGDGNGWERRMAERRDLERIEADRDDLNHRTILQLKALLNDEQERRIGIAEALD